jgi:hypothetical protein
MAKSLSRGMARFVRRRGDRWVVALHAASFSVNRFYILSNRVQKRSVRSVFFE